MDGEGVKEQVVKRRFKGPFVPSPTTCFQAKIVSKGKERFQMDESLEFLYYIKLYCLLTEEDIKTAISSRRGKHDFTEQVSKDGGEKNIKFLFFLSTRASSLRKSRTQVTAAHRKMHNSST